MNGAQGDRLLTVEQAADRLNTSVRFVRRLITERRIAYVKLGRHVHIAEADVMAFIQASRVKPIDASVIWRRNRQVA